MGTPIAGVDTFNIGKQAKERKHKREKCQLTTRISQLSTNAAVE
jgi:hypothetical protein